MSATKLSIYNGALRLLGERKTTLTENRPARHYLDDAWDDGLVDAALEEGYWSFATRTVEIAASTSVSPDFGFQYAFEKPDDYIKLAGIYSDETCLNTVHRYSDEGGYFFCDFDVFYLQYVSNDVLFGNNMALWPRSFQKLAQAMLADEVKELIQGNDMKFQTVKAALKEAKTQARSKDAMNRPTRFQPTGTWVNSRMTSRVNVDEYR